MLQASHVASSFVAAAMMGGLFFLTGATRSPTMPSGIDVQRINVREPDGTLRMVLYGAAREPGIIIAGHEQPNPGGQSAGILYYNKEGTENGGLIFDGEHDGHGTRHSGGSLTFDRYKQDQVVQLVGSEAGSGCRRTWRETNADAPCPTYCPGGTRRPADRLECGPGSAPARRPAALCRPCFATCPGPPA